MKKITINLSNRWLYSILAVVIVILAGVAVWALEAGVAGDPGHTMATIAPPSPCAIGQFLNWTGTDWVCADLPAGGGGGSDWGDCIGGVCYTTGHIKLETSEKCIEFHSGGKICSKT